MLNLLILHGKSQVHGWLVDPQSPEHDIVSKARDYDTYVRIEMNEVVQLLLT